ncbi:AhpC/TSA family protein [Hymenobacter oligotrophus]|uniref:AhpC/TSA family protein n=1 Tax=Hymenobacter oligotrophus TaxID=2319843 RepID=A0A3B7REH1_9BACT|nr:TlpA disulfide reductase family protein [Hymenobacter oligotrophus]AYA37646.1 AhpC/TSA family protein [Hymenobacter oligotrophus]
MHKYLLGWLLLAPGFALAQTAQPYVIKGTVGKLNAPAKIYLVRGAELADSATLRNGAFELKGTTAEPREVRLIVRRRGGLKNAYGAVLNYRNLILEPGTIVVSTPDSLPNARVTGTQLNNDYNRLLAAYKPMTAKMDALGREAKQATEAQRNDPAFQQRLNAKFTGIWQETRQAQLGFVRANPNTWVSLNALVQVGGMGVPQYAELAPLYQALSPALKNSPAGKSFGEKLETVKDIAIGAPAPAFSQQTPEGKTISLADYRGKYVLVDFWASWCGPCRQENPNVVQAYNQFKSRNFEILGVSLDKENAKEKWLKAIQDDKLPWTQVSDLKGWENEVARRYHVQSIPQNFLIDPAGKIVAVNLRSEELQKTLAQLLK